MSSTLTVDSAISSGSSTDGHSQSSLAASDSSGSQKQHWPNRREDYEILDVIGELGVNGSCSSR